LGYPPALGGVTGVQGAPASLGMGFSGVPGVPAGWGGGSLGSMGCLPMGEGGPWGTHQPGRGGPWGACRLEWGVHGVPASKGRGCMGCPLSKVWGPWGVWGVLQLGQGVPGVQRAPTSLGVGSLECLPTRAGGPWGAWGAHCPECGVPGAYGVSSSWGRVSLGYRGHPPAWVWGSLGRTGCLLVAVEGSLGCPSTRAGGPWGAWGAHLPGCGVPGAYGGFPSCDRGSLGGCRLGCRVRGVHSVPRNTGKGSLGSPGCRTRQGRGSVGVVGCPPGRALGDGGHVPAQVVLSRQYGSEGRFTFTSHTPGEHQICLHSNSTRMALFAGGKLVIRGGPRAQGGGVSGGGGPLTPLWPRSGCTWISRWANTPTTTPKSPPRTS